jgi:hypothetical protein
VLLELARIAFSDVRRVADWDRDTLTFKPAHAISDDDRAAVTALSVTGKRVRRVRVRLHSKLLALDVLARHLISTAPPSTSSVRALQMIKRRVRSPGSRRAWHGSCRRRTSDQTVPVATHRETPKLVSYPQYDSAECSPVHPLHRDA